MFEHAHDDAWTKQDYRQRAEVAFRSRLAADDALNIICKEVGNHRSTPLNPCGLISNSLKAHGAFEPLLRF